MASIRDRIVDELVSRLTASLPTGWSATRRTGEDAMNTAAKVAIVAPTAENIVAIDSMTFTKDLLVSVFIVGRVEDTDPTAHGGNPTSYQDELVADIERAIFAGGELEGLAEQVLHRGSAWSNPEDGSTVEAEVRLTVRYRHNIGDPDTYNPTVVL